MHKTILLVDDDKEIRGLLGQFLQKHQFQVLLARDGQQMDIMLEKHVVDLVVLDLMLPGEDGIAICRRLRRSSNIPILMLTAITEEIERILGLESGADDYLSKPFNSREVLARIKAIMRRTAGEPGGQRTPTLPRQHYYFAGWQLDDSRRQLIAPDNTEVTLSSGEYDLLLILVKNAQQVLSRDRLMTLTKNRQAEVYDRSIDIQISRLRHKLEETPKQPKLIKTIRGNGYILSCEVTQSAVPQATS